MIDTADQVFANAPVLHPESMSTAPTVWPQKDEKEEMKVFRMHVRWAETYDVVRKVVLFLNKQHKQHETLLPREDH